MILVVLALVWVVILTPIVVRKIRDNMTDRSIESFHTEHEVLSRQEYTVAPAHRLDEPDAHEVRTRSLQRRPRLTVVHDDDTYGSLESRGSWQEWEQDYDFDGDVETRRNETRNRYAAAYSQVPRESSVHATFDEPVRRTRSMKNRRRVVFTRLVAAAVVLSLASYFVGYSFILDLAVLAWLGVVGFVALALYAISQGYLNEPSLPLRLPQRRPLATVQPLYEDGPPAYEEQYADEFDDEYYDPSTDIRWRHEVRPRRALG